MRKLNNFITSGISGSYDNEGVRRAIIINLFGTIGLISLIFFGIKSVLDHRVSYTLALGFCFLFVLFILVFLRKTKNHFLASNFMVTIMFLLEIYILVRGSTDGSQFGLLWYYIIPIIALFMLGRKVGLVYILALPLITLLLFLYPIDSMPAYDPVLKLRLLYTYLVVTVLAYLYEFVREKTYHKLENARINLEQTNKQLEKLSIVARETDNAILIADSYANIEWINAGFTKMTGYQLDEFVDKFGRNIADISNNPRIHEYINKCIEKKKSVIYSTQSKTKDNRAIWVQTSLTPIFDEQNELKHIVAVDTEITALKIAEEEIKQQNEELQAQSELLIMMNETLQKNNLLITDSINYAKKIQDSILKDYTQINDFFPDSFVFFLPRDIVSGDFYWFHGGREKCFLATVDCTGHGVPGAFMSIIGNTLLNEIMGENLVISPANILNKLNDGISNALNQGYDSKDQDDGMDISLISFNRNTNELEIATAGQRVIIVKDDKLITIEGDMYSVGGAFGPPEGCQFQNHVIKIDGITKVYLATDGYQDQFGGPRNTKYMSKRFREFLYSIHKHPMDKQKELLTSNFNDWRFNPEVFDGQVKQIDDVLVIGFTVSPNLFF